MSITRGGKVIRDSDPSLQPPPVLVPAVFSRFSIVVDSPWPLHHTSHHTAAFACRPSCYGINAVTGTDGGTMTLYALDSSPTLELSVPQTPPPATGNPGLQLQPPHTPQSCSPGAVTRCAVTLAGRRSGQLSCGSRLSRFAGGTRRHAVTAVAA